MGGGGGGGGVERWDVEERGGDVGVSEGEERRDTGTRRWGTGPQDREAVNVREGVREVRGVCVVAEDWDTGERN